MSVMDKFILIFTVLNYPTLDSFATLQLIEIVSSVQPNAGGPLGDIGDFH